MYAHNHLSFLKHLNVVLKCHYLSVVLAVSHCSKLLLVVVEKGEGGEDQFKVMWPWLRVTHDINSYAEV